MGRSGYSGPADLVVDNSSDLIEHVDAPCWPFGFLR